MLDGRKPRGRALADYEAFSGAHRWKFEAMLRVQHLVPRVPPRLLARLLERMESKRFVDWSFGHYLQIAPPEFAASEADSGLHTPQAKPVAAGSRA